MKKIFVCFTVVFILGLFASCEKKLEYDIEDVDPYITLVSINNVGDFISCHVSRSNFFLDVEPEWKLENVTVQFRVNDSEWQLMRKSSYEDDYYYSSLKYDLYLCDYVVQPGDDVEIEVSHPDYNTVSSKQKAPAKPHVEIESFREKSTNIYEVVAVIYPYDEEYKDDMLFEFSSTCKAFCSINDNYQDFVENSQFSSMDRLTFEAYNTDTYMSFEGPETSFYNLVFEPSFITEPYKFKYEFDMSIYSSSDITLKSVDAKISIMPASYYKYLTTMDQSGMESYFSEKVQIFNNIENGVGNFTIKNSVVDTLLVD